MKSQNNMKCSNNSWKKVALAVIAVLLVCQPSWGQYRGGRRGGLADGDHFHFGYVSGHVGYSILDTHAQGVMASGNVAGGFGAGYEYRNSGLWANIGIQMSFHRSKLTLDPYTTDHAGVLMDGKKAINGTLHYNINQTDQIEWNFFDIPILFGYYTHGFHIGAGIKLSYALNAKSKTSGTYALTFSPDMYDAVFEDMPDKGLTDYAFDQVQNNRVNIGASLIGEIGYDLLSALPTNSRLCHILKLSFYVEYGLNNYNRGGEKQRFELPNFDEDGHARAKDVILNPYLNTEASSSRTVPFFAGAKITYMIGGSKTARAGFHRGCMCYN